MRALYFAHFLWAAMFAYVWSPDKNFDNFDILIAIVCAVWAVCAFALIFTKWWGWWGSVTASTAVVLFLGNGIRCLLFSYSVWNPKNDPKVPGWGAMLGLFIPTVVLLASLIIVKPPRRGRELEPAIQ